MENFKLSKQNFFLTILHNSAEFLATKTFPWTDSKAETASSAKSLCKKRYVLYYNQNCN